VITIRKRQISFTQKLYTCTVRNEILPGITGSWTRNPPEEWNSAGNYRLLDKESTKRMEFCWELPAPGRGICQKNGILPELLAQGHGVRLARSKFFRSVTIPGTLTVKDLYRIIFQNFNVKTL
jgi:hypothetical protein